MEPEHNVTMTDILPIFHFFDADGNGKVPLKELIEIAKIRITFHTGHKQIHLGLTDMDGEMQVMWVSNPDKYNKPAVYFGRMPTLIKDYVNATWTTYDVGKIGFHGRIYRAVIKGLTPFKNYFYKVGDL